MSCIVGQEMSSIQHKYPLETPLGQFETFVALLVDHPMSEWIGVEEVGASGAMFEVESLSREHG